MKKTFNIFLLLAAGLLALSACVETAEPYEEPAAETVVGYYFDMDATTSFILTEGGSITIPVYRVNTDDESTVSLTSSSELFEIPSSVSFSSGSNVAKIIVGYDFDKAVTGVPYTGTIEIADEATQYGRTSLTFTGTAPSAWKDFTDDAGNVVKVTFTQEWWGEIHSAYIHYTEDENGVRHCISYDEEGDLSGKYDQGPGFWGNDENTHIEFNWYTKNQNSSGYDFIELLPLYVYTNSSYSADVYAYDGYHYYHSYLASDNDNYWSGDFLSFATKSAATEEMCSYYDGNGGFYFYIVGYAMPGKGGWWPDVYDIVGIADGYTRTVDYNEDVAWKDLYSASVSSSFFEEEWDGQVVSYNESDTTLFYLKDYFSSGYGLAFTCSSGPVLFSTDATIGDAANEQDTGMSIFGSELFFNVKKGSVVAVDEETGYPTIALGLNVYGQVYDEDSESWTKTVEFGVLNDTITVTGSAWYTYEDIVGLKKATYPAYKWLSEAGDYWSDYEREYTNYTYFTDNGSDEDGNEYLGISGLTGYSATRFPNGDDIEAEWYNGYLYISSQVQEQSFSYNDTDYDVKVYLFSSEADNGYTSGYLLGGYNSDDNLIAYVNYPYNSADIDGLWFYCDLGSLAIYKNYLSYLIGEDDRSSVKAQSIGGIARRDADCGKAVKVSGRRAGTPDAAWKVQKPAKAAAAKTFNHTPVEKSASVKDFTAPISKNAPKH